nr:MAG TPA: hypothetical protein [Caudoviricetes sp.]
MKFVKIKILLRFFFFRIKTIFIFALRCKIITAQIYEIGNRIGNKLKGESLDLIKFKT